MINRQLEAAWDYHNRTKHSPASVRSSRHYLDWDNQPLPFKIYSALEPIPLPQDLSPSSVSAPDALAALPERKKAIMPDLRMLARILFFSAGITRKRKYPGGEVFFRAASCTGALYHIDLYIVCGPLPGLEAGVYHFGVHDFALRRLRSGDYREILVRASAAEPTVASAPAVIVCADTFWRNTWKYQARAYRHSFWDSGTLLANLLATAQAHEVPANVVLAFIDEEVNRLLDLDGEREAALSLVPLGFAPGESIPPAPPAGPVSLEMVPLSREEVAYPAIPRMHRSSSLVSAEEVAAWSGKTPRISLPAPSGPLFPLERDDERPASNDSLEAVILRRGSTRQFAREPISFKQFSRILRVSTQGIPADFLDPPGSFLNHLYVIALAVDGIPKGSYVYYPDRESLELLKEGDFRREGGFLGLEQELPADASVDIFFLTDLKPVLERYGNRGYRAAELEAGIIGGKLYLAAYAERLGATGLTFYDDEVTDFFSPHAEGKSVMFLMSLGRSVRQVRS